MFRKVLFIGFFMLLTPLSAQEPSQGRFEIFHGDSLGGPEKLTILLDTQTGKSWELLNYSDRTPDGQNISERYWKPVNKFDDSMGVVQWMIDYGQKIGRVGSTPTKKEKQQ